MTLTFKKALNTAIVKYLVMKNYRNLLGDNFTHIVKEPIVREGPMPIPGLLITYLASNPVLYYPSQ